MVNSKYKKYMRSPEWRAKRMQVFSRFGYRCYVCARRRGPIEVHHLTYQRFGREHINDLRPLCRDCHKAVTKLHWKLGKRKYTGHQILHVYMSMPIAEREHLRRQ